MNKNKVSLVKGDDWMGLYINDELVYEGHEISESMLLELCGIEFKNYSVDLDWIDEQGHLPESFKNIPKGKLKKNK